jgi:hypothetical protein
LRHPNLSLDQDNIMPVTVLEKPASRAIFLPLIFSAYEKPSGVGICGVSLNA